MAMHKKSKQALGRRGWDHTEINRGDGFRVAAQEFPPTLRRRFSPPDQVFGDSRLGDLELELEQFPMDARGTPQWVLLAHPSDELAQLTANSGPSRLTATRASGPTGPPALSSRIRRSQNT